MTVNGFSIIGTPAMDSLLSMPDLVADDILPNGVTLRMSREYIGRELIHTSTFKGGLQNQRPPAPALYNHRHLRQHRRIGIGIIRL